ncbi:unnamed protein product [Fraxinus pennsylvanica]|uniref:ACT domain-containing protein ACR n=1 Tax=Fraxinus pennsylvanica TaxID=56036 RepID=A0AAD2A0W0_9LAMI|nr:unnamed protein product [Fraxinus pennsylvanica]
MGILYDDLVIIRQSEKEGEPSMITVNCPDKTGLGCDLCRIFLFFGLTTAYIYGCYWFLLTFLLIFFAIPVYEDVSTDGKWCYLVFWVFGKPSTRWGLLKKRLLGACPSCFLASGIPYYEAELQPPRPPDVFLLKFCYHDRRGLLHDVTKVLCELELTIKRVKVSTTPDEKTMDLFFITDTRELLHTKKRQEDTHDHLKFVLGDAMISCDIEMDHKGLLYDIMRTLKDYNIQISYGRLTTKEKTECELDLFIMQADGKKIVDSSKQNALCSRLRMELSRPLRVAAEIGRYMIGDREWEVYRVLIDEGDGLSVSREEIEQAVWKMLMGWE